MNKVIIAICVIIFAFGLIGVFMGVETNNQCRNLCKEKNASTYLRAQNGEFNLKDDCICFYEDKYIIFTMNEDE